MRNCLLWIFMVILPQILVKSHPLNRRDENREHNYEDPQPHHLQRHGDDESSKEKVISVRITSSVAVGRRKGKHKFEIDENQKTARDFHLSSLLLDNTEPKNHGDEAHEGNSKIINKQLEIQNDEPHNAAEYRNKEPVPTTQEADTVVATGTDLFTNTPTCAVEVTSVLNGANVDYLKQLNAKKESRSHQQSIHPYQLNLRNQTNDSEESEDDDSVAETSIKSVVQIAHEDVPLGRSISRPRAEANVIRGLDIPLSHHISSPRLTTVSFNIVHDNVRDKISTLTENLQNHHPYVYNEPEKVYNEPIKIDNEPAKVYNEPAKVYNEPAKVYNEPEKVYNEPAQVYNEPSKVYSQPAKVYSEPAKVYGEPAKVYGVPAKVYGTPAKVYGEPAKVYGEPAKFYSQPASLNLPNDSAPNTTWILSSITDIRSTINPTSPSVFNEPDKHTEYDEHSTEKNFDVDEKASPLSHDSINGDQVTNPENCRQENCKVGYVVEGRQYKKYRVEEKTSDGFIVGEYGVVRNEDGALRGVRYTADGEASPRLIYDALMKFLQL